MDFCCAAFSSDISQAYISGTTDSRSCFIPCPACSVGYVVLRSAESADALAVEPDPSAPKPQPPHFWQLGECAGLLALRKTDVCQNTGQILRPEDLVPDLMFCDLPRSLIIDEIDIQQGTLLDAGGSGTVYHCNIDGRDVAVKVYATEGALMQQHHLATLRLSSGSTRHNLRNATPLELLTQRTYKTDLSEVSPSTSNLFCCSVDRN